MAASAVPKRGIFIRPRSEIITVLAGRQVPCDKSQQCPSETCLDAEFFQDEEQEANIAFICGSYEFTHEESETSEDETTSDAKKATDNFAAKLQSNVLATDDLKSQPSYPRLIKAHSMADLSRGEEVETVESQHDKKEETRKINRKKSSLDISLARLRHEMNSLRRQDVELLEQLLNLDNSIQEFKLSQSSLSESMSNLSDTSETDFEHLEMPVEKPFNTRRWRSRGSLGSDGSDYHSISSRSSIGSNNSLAGSDLTSSDSGHESVFGLKSSMKRSKGKFGSQDMRRVSFEKLKGRNGSEVPDNGSSFVFPTQAVRRNSAQFRVAELKPIQTLRKRQSTIW